MDSLKVLIVEPDRVARKNLSTVFEGLGFEVTAPVLYEQCELAAHSETFQVIAMVHPRDFNSGVAETPLDFLRSTDRGLIKIVSLDHSPELAMKLNDNGYVIINPSTMLEKNNLRELRKQISELFRSQNIEMQG